MKRSLWILCCLLAGCSLFERVEDPTDEPADAPSEAGDASVDARDSANDSSGADTFDASDTIDSAPDVADTRPDTTKDSATTDTLDAADSTTDTIDATECTPLATDSKSCGKCGTQSRTCDSTGHWGAFGACGGEGPCAPGDVTPTGGTCPSAGDVAMHTCNSSCMWGPETCVTPAGWRVMATPPLSARTYHVAVWTGTQMIVWGGQSDATGSAYYDDGAVYDVATNTWKKMAAVPTGFAKRAFPAAVWTGSKMMIWGGHATGVVYNDGLSYDPSADSWKPIAASPLDGRSPAAAFLTTRGTVAIWGNQEAPVRNDGATYNPTLDSWTTMPSSGLSPRGIIAFGGQLMVFGGIDTTTYFTDGARYNPLTFAWAPLAAAPSGYVPRTDFGEATINGGFIVLGGTTSTGTTIGDGIFFDASGASQLVTAPSSSVLSSPERLGAQVWCDDASNRCWYWSGGKVVAGSPTILGGGAALSISTKAWSPMTSVGEPSPRVRATVVWTGKSAIVWGGSTATTALADGAIFTP